MLDLNNFLMPSANGPTNFAPLSCTEPIDLPMPGKNNLVDLALSGRSKQSFALFQLLVFWLGSSMYSRRKGRHYLESNRALLAGETDRELARLILAEVEDKPVMRQQMNNHLLLLQEARRRGGTVRAIREAYIDICGGLALDLPYWLEQFEQQRAVLKRLKRPERTKSAHITLLRDAITLAQYDQSIAPEIIGKLHNELGVLLLQSAYSCTQSAHYQALQEAIACHQAALATYTPTRYPLQHAKTQICLGIAYHHYSLTGQQAALGDAISCYENALQIYTQDSFPEQWAILQTQLGNAYARNKSGDPDHNKEQAIAYHKAALQLLDDRRISASTLLAAIQVNLGDAYHQPGMSIQPDHLQEAMACYRAALKKFTQQSYPCEWASIHTRLAALFQESHAENVEQRDKSLCCAIVCYEGALYVYTPDSFPIEHAAILVHLGNSHRLRPSGDLLENLEQAAKCYSTALHVFTDNAFPSEQQQILHYLADAQARQHALIQQEQEQQMPSSQRRQSSADIVSGIQHPASSPHYSW